MALEQLSYDSSEGAQAKGLHRSIITAGATRALLAKESGSLCIFSKVDGAIYTLPTPVVGMTFDFLATASVTSNAYRVSCLTGNFIIGGVQMALPGTIAGGLNPVFNGSTHLAISSNGNTTGGVAGSKYRLTAISATVWALEGVLSATGTVATPAVT